MDELVKSLRICADGEHCDQCAKWDIKQNGGINACEYAICTEAADAIVKLQNVGNTLLAKYEEDATTVIWEYSGNIGESLDRLHEEISKYKAQINGKEE